MPGSVFLVFGDDDYKVAQEAGAIADRLVPASERALGLEVIDGRVDTAESAVRGVDQCLASVRTLGFFGGGKLTWLRDAIFFGGSAQLEKSEALRRAIASLAAAIQAGLPDGQSLLISAETVPKNGALYRACKAAGECREFASGGKPAEVEKRTADALREQLARRGLRMDRDAAQAFVARTGSKTRSLAMELDKLAVYLGDRTCVSAEDVAAVTCGSGEAKAWDLAEAVGRRDLDGALAILRQLLFLKESPFRLIIGVQSRIRDLLVCRECLRNRWLTAHPRAPASWHDVPPDVDRAFKEHFERDPRGTHPWRMGLLAAQARGFSGSQLARCQRLAVEAHESLVSSRVPPDVALEFMLIRMLS